jgi:uncharacterized membrane protein
MEPQVSQPPRKDTKLRPVWWIVAAAMTVATVLAAMERPMDWMAIAGRGALTAAAVLLATAKPEETRGKKILIYALTAVSLGLLLARIMNR